MAEEAKVFTRQFEKATVKWDCNAKKGSIVMKTDDDALSSGECGGSPFPSGVPKRFLCVSGWILPFSGLWNPALPSINLG